MALFKSIDTATEVNDQSWDRLPPPVRPPALRLPPAYLASERFAVDCVCAVHDRPYQLIFVRQPSGRLRLMESVRGSGDARAASPNMRTPLAQQIISMSDLENGPWCCAWCQNGSFHFCGSDCGALVCGGRMRGNLFVCRDSCGAQWIGSPLQQIQATPAETRRLQQPTASPVAMKGSTLPASIGSRALIIRK